MANEYSDLNDIALSRGIKHSDLIADIHVQVLEEYLKKYPKAAKNASIAVDERTGVVRILSENKDVTPPEFSQKAAEIARSVIIGKIKDTEGKVKIDSKPSRGFPLKGIFSLFFWGYNCIYLLFAFIFLISFLANGDYRSEILKNLSSLGVLRGSLLLLLVLIPIISLITAVKAKLSSDPILLGKLLFLMEIPFVGVLLNLVSGSADFTPAMMFFILMMLITLGVFFIDLVKLKTTSKLKNLILLAFQQTSLTSVGYVTFLYSFFVPVILGGLFVDLIPGIFENLFLHPFRLDILELIFTVIFFALGIGLIFIVGMLITIPYLITYILYTYLRHTSNELSTQISKNRLQSIHLVLGATFFILLTLVSYQPNADVYIDLLANIRQAPTFEDKELIAKELLPQETKIKRAFEDMVLARKRYFMAKSDDMIKDIYKSSLKFSDVSAETVQSVFMFAAYPFIYQGNLDRQNEAYNNYEYLFGKPLKEIKITDPAENVNLLNRHVDAVTDYSGLLATINIEEEYQNKSQRNQEVIYEFSLPESTTITSLLLGPNLEFEGVIAPRGAAAQVYQQEVSRRRDPALIEQTGPAQYRLRVFPIPPKSDPKKLKVRYTYVASAESTGFPLPTYTKIQNIDLGNSDSYTYKIDGQPALFDQTANSISNNSTKTASELCGINQSFNLKTQSSVSAQITPYTNIFPNASCNEKNGFDLTGEFTGKRLAILYDVSYPNKENPFLGELKEFISSHPTLLSSNTVDLYLFNDSLSQKRELSENLLSNDSIIHFGKSDFLKAITLLENTYDLIIVSASNTLPDQVSTKQTPTFSSPVYFLYQDRKAPPYPQKLTDNLINKGGTVLESIEQVFSHYQLSLKSEIGANRIFTPFWILESSGFKDPNAIPPTPSDPLTYFANKANIIKFFDYVEFSPNSPAQTSTLDGLHEFALNAHVVTPSSSLIALVNETQAAELERLSQGQSRYNSPAPVSPPPVTFPNFESLPRSLSPMSMFSADVLNIGLPSGNIMLESGGGYGGFSIISAIPLLVIFVLIPLGFGGFLFVAINLKRRVFKN